VRRWTGELKARALLEAICAIHLSSYVESPVQDRGGLMIVGPAGVLKTTFLDILDEYPNAVCSSNLNTQTVVKMLPEAVNGSLRSIVIPDLQAIYAGDPRTSARLEQMIMQLTGEGSRGPSWADSRFQKFKSRCAIFGAMTPDHFERYSNRWEASGFLRRFLWASYSLSDPEVLMNAIEQWKRADLGAISSLPVPQIPGSRSIPDSLTRDERRSIRLWLKHQPGPHEIQFSMLCRATAALRWSYQQQRVKLNALDTMRAFAETLQKDAARVTL
jgi:hypothetical protein